MQLDKTEKDLDHNQDKTDVIAKSEKPDTEFMEDERLCRKCHGPMSFCNGECGK